MNTADAIRAIRKALRRKGTTATLSTRIGYMPTTKAAVGELLPTLGEVTWESREGDSWSFTAEGDDFDTSVSVYDDGVMVECGS